MPILAPEPAAYPLNLWEAESESLPVEPEHEGLQRNWWVLQTKSRHEKALARDLSRTETPFYLPLTTHETVIRGKVHESSTPVLSGYLFLYGSEYERSQAFRTNRVANALPVHDQDQLVHELRNLAALIAAGVPLTLEKRLVPGQKVRVKRGALMGLEGVILQRRGVNRLLLAVTYLQQGVSVEIGDFMVEPL